MRKNQMCSPLSRHPKYGQFVTFCGQMAFCETERIAQCLQQYEAL